MGMFTLGGRNSGTQFHTHGPAFLTLFSGRKVWYIHKPGTFPNKSAAALHRTVQTWASTVLPTLDGSKPTSCLQYPGETLYVPDSWSHATINLDLAIGVSWQRTTAKTDICKEGFDYMCLHQKFVSAEFLKDDKKPSTYRTLFNSAEQVTDGQPYGFLRYIAPFWKV